MGLLGSVLLKIVDEEELIDEAVEELERSGLLEDNAFFRRNGGQNGYGPFEDGSDEEVTEARRTEEAKARDEEEARKKTWLLNEETRRFLKDHTMWWLAAGFFFVSGEFLLVRLTAQYLTTVQVQARLSLLTSGP